MEYIYCSAILGLLFAVPASMGVTSDNIEITIGIRIYAASLAFVFGWALSWSVFVPIIIVVEMIFGA